MRLLDWQSAIHHAGNTGCMARHHIVAEVSNAVTRLWRLWDWQVAIHPGNTCCRRDAMMTHCCNHTVMNASDLRHRQVTVVTL